MGVVRFSPLLLACAATIAAAAGPARARADGVVVERESGGPFARSLPQQVRLSAFDAAEPTHVSLCEDHGCRLFRTLTLAPGEVHEVRTHFPFGKIVANDPDDDVELSSPSRGEVSSAHAIGLYGAFEGEAVQTAGLASASDQHAAGGVTPVEATSLLRARPEMALAFDGVAIAPGADIDGGLLASLTRLVAAGGVVALPASLRERFELAGEGEPVTIDPALRLVALASQRTIVEGARHYDARAFRSAGVFVVYEDAALSKTLLADVLLAVAPRFREPPRAVVSDPRVSPAADAATLAASRTQSANLLWIPALLALALAAGALVARRRRGVIPLGALTLASVVISLALVWWGRAMVPEATEARVRVYTSLDGARVAFEEGALAKRLAPGGGVVELRAPRGTAPIAAVRGLEPRRTEVTVGDRGSTLRFELPGDSVGVAAWLRPVDLDAGLRVRGSDGAWPSSVRDVIVENGLPFALERVRVVSAGGPVLEARLEAGATRASWAETETHWDTSRVHGSEPLALAKNHLLTALEQRCRWYTNDTARVSCVVAIGVAKDGSLIGLQVLSP